MANTSTNVSAGKPNVSGAIWWAPKGTTLPTSATASLNQAFRALGYVSDDGLKNKNTPSSDDVKAWGGDVVLTTQTEKSDEFEFTLIESLNVDVLKAIYGSDNVSGSLSTGITVRANSKEVEAASWVIDTIMTGGVLKRTVIEAGKLAELGDIVYKDNEPIGYEVTLKALPGSAAFDGDTHKEYIVEAPTTANASVTPASSGTSGTSGTSN